MANFKKIWKSLDFRNNKIINAKTNTPTDLEHIVPKSYVDINKTYDTVKAQTQNNPIKFSWITNVYNKSFKEIFDDLFFPITNPVYLNPTFINIDLSVFSEYYILGEKKAIFLNRLTKFRIDYSITESDRISGVTPIIIITSKTGTVSEYSGTLTSDIIGFIEFEFMFINIESIILRKVFQEATVIKQDNYGNNYIPIDFTIDYNLDFNVLKLINEKFIVYPPMLYYKLGLNDFHTIIDGIAENDDLVSSSSLNMFIKNRSFLVNGTNNIYLLGIPEPLYNNSIMLLNIDGKQYKFNIKNLKDNLDESINYDNIKSLIYFDSIINYYFGIIDFGTFLESKKIDFQYNLFTI